VRIAVRTPIPDTRKPGPNPGWAVGESRPGSHQILSTCTSCPQIVVFDRIHNLLNTRDSAPPKAGLREFARRE